VKQPGPGLTLDVPDCSILILILSVEVRPRWVSQMQILGILSSPQSHPQFHLREVEGEVGPASCYRSHPPTCPRQSCLPLEPD
jgi:hypothetical protein